LVITYQHLYLVNFDPSIGHEYQKVRPALVVQSDDITEISSVVTIIPISSNLASATSVDIIIRKDSMNNLFKDSVLKMHHISSFDKRRFIHHIGKLSDEQMDFVKEKLKSHFSL
jgi:mRNA interferase MazF